MIQVYFTGFASLFSTVYTTMNMNRIIHPSLTIQRGSYAFVFVAHFALYLGSYIYSAKLVEYSNPNTQDWSLVLTGWLVNWNNNGSDYWFLFVFLWDLIPMNYAAYLIANRKGNLKLNQVLPTLMSMKSNRYWILVNIGQILIIAIFYIITCLGTYSLVFKSDRSILAGSGIRLSLISLHTVLDVALIEAVKTMLIANRDSKGEKQPLKNLSLKVKAKATISKVSKITTNADDHE